MSISVVGYFSDHSGRTVGEKWQTCRDADQLNLLRSICARRPTGQRQTLCTLDIFQTSSAACLLLNYRLYTRGRCVQCPATDATLTEEVVCVSCRTRLSCRVVSVSLTSDGKPQIEFPRVFHPVCDSCHRLTMIKRVVYLVYFWSSFS